SNDNIITNTSLHYNGNDDNNNVCSKNNNTNIGFNGLSYKEYIDNSTTLIDYQNKSTALQIQPISRESDFFNETRNISHSFRNTNTNTNNTNSRLIHVTNYPTYGSTLKRPVYCKCNNSSNNNCECNSHDFYNEINSSTNSGFEYRGN